MKFAINIYNGPYDYTIIIKTTIIINNYPINYQDARWKEIYHNASI